MFPSSFYLRLPCVHTTSWTRRKKRGEIPNKKKKRIFCCFYGIYSRTLVSSGFFGREKCCKNGNDKWSRFSALPFPRAKIVFFITDGISFNFFISFFAAVEYRDIVDRFYPSGWRTSPLCSLPGHQWRHCVLNWGSREREREERAKSCVRLYTERPRSIFACRGKRLVAVPSFGKVFPIYPGITRRSLSRRGERKRIRFTVERLFTGFNNGAHPTSSLSLSPSKTFSSSLASPSCN